MPIYRLDPIITKIDDPNWQASTENSVGCWVRAETEQDARRWVIHVTFIATGRQPGETIRTSPWADPKLTSCCEDRPVFDVPEGVVFTTDGRMLPIT